MLTSQQAVEIFKARPLGDSLTKPSITLSERYHVSPKTIRDIWNGRSWYKETYMLDKDKPPIAHRLCTRPGRPPGKKDSQPRRKNDSKSRSNWYISRRTSTKNPDSFGHDHCIEISTSVAHLGHEFVQYGIDPHNHGKQRSSQDVSKKESDLRTAWHDLEFPLRSRETYKGQSGTWDLGGHDVSTQSGKTENIGCDAASTHRFIAGAHYRRCEVCYLQEVTSPFPEEPMEAVDAWNHQAVDETHAHALSDGCRRNRSATEPALIAFGTWPRGPIWGEGSQGRSFSNTQGGHTDSRPAPAAGDPEGAGWMAAAAGGEPQAFGDPFREDWTHWLRVAGASPCAATAAPTWDNE